jgi:CO/xanthine dehydrogenase Mo-binding subunit
MDGFEFKDEYFMDLTELLPEDVYQVFGEQNDKYSITIDSDELAEELEVTYEPVRIGVLANSENVENAVKWLTKLAEELS